MAELWSRGGATSACTSRARTRPWAAAGATDSSPSGRGSAICRHCLVFLDQCPEPILSDGWACASRSWDRRDGDDEEERDVGVGSHADVAERGCSAWSPASRYDRPVG